MFAASKTSAVATGSPPPATDPQFNYVTMLLHGDGTNGAQNNTFVDSSTNNFTITRNGTPTQGSFSPYGDLWSNQFSGTQYFVLGGQSAFSFNADFTIEMWFNAAGAGTGTPKLYESRGSGQEGVYVTIEHSGTSLVFRMSSAARITTTFAYNTWNHVALVRSSGVITMYLNGVSAGTYSTSATTLVGTSRPCIGAYPGFDNFNGYISNLRVVKGTALYTSNFTPSSTPLTAVSGTSLLTCQSNRFRDNSSNNFAINVTGAPSVQRFSPFDPAAEYSTSVIGGSGYFGTSGQSVQAASNAAFTFGTGDFTVEYFVYATSWSSSPTIVDLRSSNPSSGGYGDYYSTAGKFNLYWGTTTVYTSAATLGLNQWHHIAVSRSGSTVRVFVNGVLDGTFTNAFNFTDSNCRIGANTNATPAGIVGYLSDTRIVKGTAVYTSAFTPPTAPLTAITNTSLLLNTVNAGIFDNAMMNDLVTVGNAQISTSVKKYGTGSMAFDGSGDWLTTVNSPNFDLSTGSWTIEGWMYVTGGTYYRTMVAKRVASGAACEWEFGVSNTSTLYFYRTGTAVNGSTTVPSNTWVHAAVTYDGTTLRMFQNGTVVYTQSGLTAASGTNNVTVGNYGASGDQPWFGYIDDLRITKGVARYTANFTPPTAAFPNN